LLTASNAKPVRMNDNDLVPDALAAVLGRVVADVRRDFGRELERIEVERRALIAELKTADIEFRNQLRDHVESELKQMRDLALGLKDGQNGADGAPGEQGPAGPAPDYGIVLERSEPLIKNLIAARWDDWTKTLPLPERGEPGLPGEKGDPGPAVDPELIQRMVDDAVTKIPPARDGMPGERGEKGEPGEPGLPGEKGDPGQPGLDGCDPDPELVEVLVAEKVAEAMAALPPPPKGEKGDPGERGEPGETGEPGVPGSDGAPGEKGERGEPGIPGEPGEKGEAGLPGERGEKGDQGLSGDRGEPGLPGERGEKGEPGRDGVGLAGCLINRDGHFVVTLSDGTARELGEIVGKDGAPGKNGQDGAPGRDGKDGLSFDAFKLEPEYDGERTVTLKWANAAGKVHVQEWRFPFVIDRGVYKAGHQYETGDSVTFGGSIWNCLMPTTDKPGNGSTAWRLAVKHGRDGRDGLPGEKGDRGPPGEPGRDWTAQGYNRP
jgi:collagen type III alpha